jgi:CheY-like chemotaxis protein
MEKVEQGILMLERVLLVDDDAISLYIAKRLLKDAVSEPIQTAMNGAPPPDALK